MSDLDREALERLDFAALGALFATYGINPARHGIELTTWRSLASSGQQSDRPGLYRLDVGDLGSIPLFSCRRGHFAIRTRVRSAQVPAHSASTSPKQPPLFLLDCFWAVRS